MKAFKRICALFLVFAMLVSMAACKDTKTDETFSETHQQLDREIGAFEITAHQRELAKTNTAGYSVLDAGRGNPNWINTQARLAFARFMEYAVDECSLTMSQDDMAGQASQDGIAQRFEAAMNPEDETDAFILKAIDYCVKDLGLNKADLLKELVDGIIGDYYPSPSRCLSCTENILNAYLESTLYNGEILADQTEVFPVEGGSAAICYIFNALNHNRVLKSGDKIAIATPIFTPYLQIPGVNNYGLVSIDVTSTDEDNWDINAEELKKLEDPSVKAFFLVNPSNPASHALSTKTLDSLKELVKKNPNLIILTDDVYGTFVNNFQTVYSVLPYNTILVYSFSKLYGVTGWRIGLIAMNKENVVDKLLGELPKEDKDFLHSEYSIVTTSPENLKFIDRIVADSRSIGLYHTSGLSTPQQIFMDFLALTHLICESEDPYIELANEIVNERYETFMNAIGLPSDAAEENAKYYAVIDMQELIKKHYDDKFAEWMNTNVSNLDFLNDLAKEKGVVLMYGPGFDAPEDTVRVSLANLDKEDYVELASRIYELLDEYYEKSL